MRRRRAQVNRRVPEKLESWDICLKCLHSQCPLELTHQLNISHSVQLEGDILLSVSLKFGVQFHVLRSLIFEAFAGQPVTCQSIALLVLCAAVSRCRWFLSNFPLAVFSAETVWSFQFSSESCCISGALVLPIDVGLLPEKAP
jgi:hypothetical protein